MAQPDDQPRSFPGNFDAFYRIEYPRVVALTYALGGRTVAEDLAQEAFLRAHRDWDDVGRMAAPGAWVRRVAVNLCRSRWRRLRSETAASVRLTAGNRTFEPLSPEHDGFWDEVRRLSDRQAQAIALRYLDDLPVAGIAEVLDVAEGTVKALLSQGRTRLERELAARGWLDS